LKHIKTLQDIFYTEFITLNSVFQTLEKKQAQVEGIEGS